MRDKNLGCLYIGIAIGLVHGAFLYLFMATMTTASLILYGNIYQIAVVGTTAIDLLVISTVLSSDRWLPFMLNLVDNYAYKPEE
jgi:hypothetical protein